jgi:hypothetical protein
LQARLLCRMRHCKSRSGSRGFSSIVGAIFMVLIMVVLASNYFIFTLSQNTVYNNGVGQMNQLDANRLAENVVASNLNYSVLGNVVSVTAQLQNLGSTSVRVVTLWVLDTTNNQKGFNNSVACTLLPGSIALLNGASAIRVALVGASSADAFNSWFITALGNTVTSSVTFNFTEIETLVAAAQVHTQGVFAVNWFYCKYTSALTPYRTDLHQLLCPNGDTPSSYRDTYVAFYLNLTNVWTYPVTIKSQSSLTLVIYEADPEFSIVKNVSYSGTRTLTPYNDANQITIDPGQATELIFAAGMSQTGRPAPAGSTWQWDTQAPISGYSPMSEGAAISISVFYILNGYSTRLFGQVLAAQAIYLSYDTAPAIALSPWIGPVGTSVTVSGAHFAASSAMTIKYDGTQVATTTTTTSGTIPSDAVFTIPASAFGAHEVTATDASGKSATNTFGVSSPSININPVVGPTGTTVTVSGQSFEANSVMTITFAGTAVTTSPATVTTDTNGSFSGVTFTVPSATPGAKTVQAMDADGNSASATFVVPGPLGLDGSNSAYTSGSTINIPSFTTTYAGDIIYVSVVESSGYTISSVTSTPSLTWAQRASVPFSSGRHLETWYAVWSSSGPITITITMTGSSSSAAVAFAVSGANMTSPFDGTPSSNTGTSASAITSITTTNANDFIIGALGVQGTPSLTTGSGFTLVRTQTAGTYRETSDEYKIVSTTQSGLTVGYSWSGSQEWAMIADAIKKAS